MNTYDPNQMPTSRPPEPPYRSDYNPQPTSPYASESQQQPQPYGQQQAAYEPTQAYEQQPTQAYEQQPTQAYEQQPTQPYEPQSQPQPTYEPQPTQRFEAQPFESAPQREYATSQQQAQPYEPQPQQQPAGQPQPAQIRSHTVRAGNPEAYAATHARQKQGGAGKTFLFGFLGALLACVLCIGGFGLFNSSTGGGFNTTYIGTKDSSVIDAVEEGQTLAEAVAAKALPSVVAVYNYQEQQTTNMFGYGTVDSSSSDGLSAAGMGSGVVISDDGYILTNYHVVEDAKAITVTVDGEERDAKYIGGDSSSDVAVVKVSDTQGLVPADIGNSDDLVIGEWVMTIGAPLGLEQSVATGVVSATNRSTIMDSSQDGYSMYSSQSTEYTYYPNMIQTDAVINPGNSGGALVDADGKLIGINTMISSYSGDYAGVGFAIPVNYAIGIASDIIEGKTPTHAMLGVSISSVNANNAQRYGFDVTTGAYINAISPDTGAADSDLQVGDIITAIDGTKVESATDVTLAVRSHKVGDTVTVTVNRNGQTHEVEVKLSSDENITKQDAESQDQDQSQDQQSPYGQSPYGNGQGNSYNQQYIEELLKMLGM